MKLKSIEAKPDFQVREDWDVLRFWQIVDLRSQKNRPDMQLLSVFLNRGVIKYGEGGGQVHKPGRDLSVYQVVREGDLVMNNQQAWRGSVGVSRYDGIISPAYLVLRLRSCLLPRFGDYLFQSRPMVNQWVTSSKGVGDIQRDIFVPWLKKAKVAIPSKDEQELIVRFLDWASVRLEKAIRAKRRVIALLEEQRKVIIQSAITETLGDDCPTVPIRAMLRPVKRLGYPDKMILSLFRDYGVIPKESRENKNVDVRDLALCQLVEPGDVVMNKMKAWQGSIAVSELEGIASPDYMVLKFQMGPVVGKFFHYVLRSPNMIADYRRNAYGVRPGQWRLMYQEFSRLRLPLPTEDVQQAVVDRITNQTTALDKAIASEQKQMTLLREYRTRLISDVVTGKLDVRDVARSLPSESEAMESIDDMTTPDADFADDELETELAEEAV